MSQAANLSDLKLANRRGLAARRSAAFHDGGGQPGVPAPNTHASRAGDIPADARGGMESHGELERLYLSLSAVNPENHPRTARLLAASRRKAAQKVIEEAGEVALEAVKHHPGGIVRESADLLYHLVALWHRAGIEPECVWIEMRRRAEEFGIAEKLPKARHRTADLLRPILKKGGRHDQGK